MFTENPERLPPTREEFSKLTEANSACYCTCEAFIEAGHYRTATLLRDIKVY